MMLVTTFKDAATSFTLARYVFIICQAKHRMYVSPQPTKACQRRLEQRLAQVDTCHGPWCDI